MNKRTYSVLVIGDKPEEQMELFNSSIKGEKYIKYYIKDSKSIYNKTIKTLETLIKQHGNSYLNSYLDDIKDMTDIEYFSSLTKDLIHDEEGNAWDDSNQNGKWVNYKLGDEFSTPLISLNGEKKFQIKKGEVDWNKMHLNDSNLYSKTWDLVMGTIIPQTPNEVHIQSVMSPHEEYLKSFGTKENYINFNTSYWNYAVVKDSSWVDMDNKNSFEWVGQFYNTFIEPLDDDTLLTIFEYHVE